MLAIWIAITAAQGGAPFVSEGPLEIKNVRVAPTSPKRFKGVDITFALTGTWSNPLDPGQIDITATVNGPDDLVSVIHGFLFQDYDSQLQNGVEKLTPIGEAEWKLRFAPWNHGSFSVYIRAADTLRTFEHKKIGLRVGQANGGFVEAKENRRYFYIGEKSIPLAGITINDPGPGGTLALEGLLSQIAKSGVNLIRVELSPGLFEPWRLPSEYALRADSLMLTSAWRIERLLRIAKANGIYVILSVCSQLELEAGWSGSAYNKRNGGPCEVPADFWQNIKARLAFKRALRYLVSRLQNFDNILGIELFSGGKAPAYWVQEMANEVVGVHTYLLPITATPGAPDVWELRRVGYASPVAVFGDSVSTTAANVVNVIKSARSASAKPTIALMQGAPLNQDIARVALWSALAAGGGAIIPVPQASPSFKLDELFKPFRAFIDNIAWQARRFTDPPIEGASVQGWAQVDENGGFAYLLSLDGRSGSIETTVPRAGHFTYSWIDASTGTVIASGEAKSNKNRLAIPHPAFSVDILLDLRRR